MPISSPRSPSMNPQFQAQYDEEQRKMELAKALMAQSQKSPLDYLEQPRTAQMAKLGLGPAIAPLIQAITGGLTARNAQQGMAGAQQANANEVAGGKAQYALMPDKLKSAESLMSSTNPELAAFGRSEREYQQKIADELAKREEARLLGAAKIAGPETPTAAVDWLRNGKIDPNWKAPELDAPTFGVDPGGNSYSLLNQPGRKRDLKYAPKATSVSVDTAGEKAGITALGKKLPEIAEKTMTTMQGAVKALDDAERIYSLANDPEVTTGALAEPEIFLRNLAVKLGGSGAEGVAKTQALVSSIAEQTLDASIDLKGAITEKEWPRLAQARAGEISYTPAALKTLAQIQRAKEFNKYIQALNQRESGKKNGIGGIEANLAMFPAPALGSRVFPEEEFGSRPDGTVFYKGSTEPLFGGNKRMPATAPTGPGVKPTKSMSKAEMEAEIKALEAELFGGRK